MAERVVDLIFPAAGLDEKLSYQSQRPYTTTSAENVRATGTLEGRERGGSRPGIVKAFGEELGSGNPVRLLSAVRTATTDRSRTWRDDFIHYGREGEDIEGNWTAASWLPGGLPEYSDPTYEGGSVLGPSMANLAGLLATATASKGALVTLLTDLDSTANYRISFNWKSWLGTPGTYAYIYLRMNDTGSMATWGENGGIEVICKSTDMEYINIAAYDSGGSSVYDSGFSEVGTRNSVETISVTYNPTTKVLTTKWAGVDQISATFDHGNDGNLGDTIASGTMVGQPVFGDPESTITASGTPFSATDVGGTIGFDDSGNEYVISAYNSATEIEVTGDASGEKNNDTFVTYQEDDVGSDVGFAVAIVSTYTGWSFIDYFQVEYSTDIDTEQKRVYAVASSNGTTYRDDDLGVWAAIGAGNSRTLATDRKVNAVDRLQKLYIADHGLKHTQLDGAVGATPFKTFTSALVGDFTAADPAVVAGADIDDCVVLQNTGDDGKAIADIYRIGSIATTTITLIRAAATVAEAGISYRIERTPKIYDPIDNTLDAWTASTNGPALGDVVPVGCPLIAVFLDRIVLGGAITSPHVFYMSAISDPHDWAYGVEPGGAVAGDGTHDVGQVGAPLTAIIVHSNDYCIFAADAGIWVLRGDPTYGGRIDTLSRDIGVIDANAHCRTPEGETVFLSRKGLYKIGAGAMSYPEPISELRLPQHLKHINTGTHTVHMAYDVDDEGIHIFVTPNDTGGGAHWFLNWRTKAFWPVSIQNAQEPFSVFQYEADAPGDSAVLMGGRDGYVRKFSAAAYDDDGTAFTNHVYIGPIRTSNTGYNDGLVKQLIATLASSSGDVAWSLHVGETAQEAAKATAFDSGTWSAGINPKVRPRARCTSFFLKLANGTDNDPWAMERVTAVIKRMGAQRL